MPTSLKGPGDASVTIWGSGTPRREFLHVDDLAGAILYLLVAYDAVPIVNIGWGEDITIREFAELVPSVVAYRGRPKIMLKLGIESTCTWLQENPIEAGL